MNLRLRFAVSHIRARARASEEMENLDEVLEEVRQKNKQNRLRKNSTGVFAYDCHHHDIEISEIFAGIS